MLSSGTYTGNLGGLGGDIWTPGGADATCLTELTTHTGWKGYATASANGQLIADKVHAFLSDDGSASKQLLPNATYAFANAGDGTAGGATFTTNSSGFGPGDSADWSGATYFNGDFKYWTGVEPPGKHATRPKIGTPGRTPKTASTASRPIQMAADGHRRPTKPAITYTTSFALRIHEIVF